MDNRELRRKAEVAGLLLHAARRLAESIEPERGNGQASAAERTTFHRARRLARPRLEPRLALLAQLVEHLHGKEGVDGSSPSEGLQKRPA